MAHTILIVDDSRTMRKVIQKCLLLTGLEIGNFLEAGDGREALALLRAQEVHLVLSDLNMPGMNGIEMFKEIQGDEKLRHIPVLFITTFGYEKVRQEARDLGIGEYIQKPFRPEVIRDLLLRTMEKNCV